MPVIIHCAMASLTCYLQAGIRSVLPDLKPFDSQVLFCELLLYVLGEPICRIVFALHLAVAKHSLHRFSLEPQALNVNVPELAGPLPLGYAEGG